MGSIRSRIRPAPFSPSGWRELAASCALSSNVAAAWAVQSGEVTWEELAAVVAVPSSVAVTLSLAQWQEMAAAASIPSSVVQSFTLSQWQEMAAAVTFPSGVAVSLAQSNPADLRNQPNAAQLAAYWDLDLGGVTLSTTPDKRGAAPKAVTFGGNLAQVASVRIEITGAGDVGVGTCRISLRSAYDYYAPPTTYAPEGGLTPEEYSGTIPASLTLSNGIIVTFPSGSSYATDEIYMAKVASLASFGTDANCTLTDALISGPVVEWNGYMNRAHCLCFSGHGLSNELGVPAVVSGTNVPFHVQAWMQIYTLAGGATALVPWAFSNQSSGSNTKNILDVFYSGPTATPANAWGFQRRDNVPNATKQYTSAAVPDMSFHHQAWDFDGTLGTFYRNNLLDSSTGAGQNIATGGTTALDRFTLGFCKFGTASATNHAFMRLVKFGLWRAAKNAADRTAIAIGAS